MVLTVLNLEALLTDLPSSTYGEPVVFETQDQRLGVCSAYANRIAYV